MELVLLSCLSMKTLLLIFTIFFSFSLQAQTRSLKVSLGEEKPLHFRGKGSVWIQDSKILKAIPAAGGIRVRGLKEGVTTLKLGDEVYEVQVFHPGKLVVQDSLSSEVSRLVGLSTELQEGKILVKGRLYRWKDWSDLKKISLKYKVRFQMTADIPRALREESQKQFSQLLERARLPPQTLIFEPAPEIRVAGSEMTFKKYDQLLSPYGIEVIKDEQSIEIAPTIKVQITVAEIKRDLSMKYGLRWPSSYSAKILPTGERLLDELPFNATALEAQGLGKILASPNIICRSGKEAEFLAGGEFPIKILNYKMQDIVWKKYGILLKVKPVADSSGRMSISIETEVSTLDDSRRVDDIPGLLTNHVSSHFDLSRPRTIALSGLLKSEDSKSHEGVPFLARIPVLGALFSSKDFKENRSELVIFVRPSILKEDEYENSNPQHVGDLEQR
ncbi:Type II secretion system protein D precursor [compost metagenome]